MTTTIDDHPVTSTVEDIAATVTPDQAAALTPAGTGASAMALRDDQTDWTPDQRAMLTAIGVAEDASAAELRVFLYECQRRRLDPFAKQIYLIGRNDRQADRVVYRSQTSIDGFRLIARRAADEAGHTLGYEDTIWYDTKGKEHKIWLSSEPPAGAKVVVLRNGERFPAEARFAAYAATWPNGEPKNLWKTMPDVLISKCCEALALRRAFPEDLGGLYTLEEMEQADNERPAPTPSANSGGDRGRGGQSRNQGRNSNGNNQGRPAAAAREDPTSEPNRKWLTDAIGDAATMDARQLTALTAEARKRTESGALTRDDAWAVRDRIDARRADLKTEALKATQLGPDDDWADAINGITCEEDAIPMRTDLTGQRRQKKITDDRYQQVMRAVNGKVQMLIDAAEASDGAVEGVVVGQVPPQEDAA